MNRTQQVAQAFSSAAHSYDQHSLVQTYVANYLIHRIKKEHPTPLGVVLEVGCGTGYLAEQLAPKSHHYVMTDLSYPLLSQAQGKMSGENVSAVVVNGELPCFTAGFDVIVANLVLHWFENPKNALNSLAACLKPGGMLYLTSLGNNTFFEWRSAHMKLEASCGLLDFITYGQLKDWLPLSGERTVEEEWLTLTPKDAMEFLRGLKGMGGILSHPGHKPLPVKTFRKVMDVYNQSPRTTYQILFASYQRPLKIREE